MKYLKIGPYGLAALAIILLAATIRLILITQNWPLTNSDEGTIGIMALHIAYHGAHPIFYYGQGYMGVGEAYLSAVLFHLFSPSLFTLRLELVLMFVLFMACMYLITRLLYSKGLALVTLLLLGLGSSYIMARQLSAIGGYPETPLFAAFLFVLASWLTRSYTPQPSRRQTLFRLLAYLSWGLVTGIGLWTDLLIAPFVLTSGLLMLIFCWREWLRILAPLGMLIGLTTGLLPMLLYNISSQQGKYGNSLTILLELINGGPSPMKHTLTTLMHELHGTIGISIPMMTGEPFCPVTEIPFLGPNSPHSSSCTLIHWSWGLGYLLLFIIALIVASFAVWHALKAYHHRQDQSQYKHEYQELVRSTGRLTLLISGLLSLIIYTYSSPPTLWPGIFARYLIGLLLITPALIAPLWQAMVSNLGNKQHPATRHGMIFAAGSGLVLTLIGVFLVIGVFTTFGEIPYDTQRYQTDMHLIQNLEHLGIKHAYTDYWTCDKMAFLSNEQIICGVVNQQSAPGLNRYMPYYTAVKQDPGAAYLFPINPNIPPGSIHIKNIEQRLKDFHRYIMDGYIIYLPG